MFSRVIVKTILINIERQTVSYNVGENARVRLKCLRLKPFRRGNDAPPRGEACTVVLETPKKLQFYPYAITELFFKIMSFDC